MPAQGVSVWINCMLRLEWSRDVHIHTEFRWILSSCIPRHTHARNGKGQRLRKIVVMSVPLDLNQILIDTDKLVWAPAESRICDARVLASCSRMPGSEQWVSNQHHFTGNQPPLLLSHPVNTRWAFFHFNIKRTECHAPCTNPWRHVVGEDGTACERV